MCICVCGCAVLLCLVVCTTSFFLPSHLSLTCIYLNMYINMYHITSMFLTCTARVALRRLCTMLTTVLGHTSGIVANANATRHRHSCITTSRGPLHEQCAMAENSSIRRLSYWSLGSSDLEVRETGKRYMYMYMRMGRGRGRGRGKRYMYMRMGRGRGSGKLPSPPP